MSERAPPQLEPLPGDPPGLQRLLQTPADLSRRLTALPAFTGFSLRELAALAEVMELVKAPDKMPFGKPATPPRFAWLLLEGRAQYNLGVGDAQQTLLEIDAGHWIMASHALAELPIPGVWQTTSPAVLMRIAVGRLHQLQHSSAAVAAKLVLLLRAETGRSMQQTAESTLALANA
jgi:hypothetical protein